MSQDDVAGVMGENARRFLLQWLPPAVPLDAQSPSTPTPTVNPGAVQR
jgi:hypothetical protein